MSFYKSQTAKKLCESLLALALRRELRTASYWNDGLFWHKAKSDNSLKVYLVTEL
jgi:hypothetical protein